MSRSTSASILRNLPVPQNANIFHPSAPPTMRPVLPLIVLAAVLAGCGYKGPLYLPKPKPEAQQPAPKPAPAPVERTTPGDR